MDQGTITWALTFDERCRRCGETCAGIFEAAAGGWGAFRRPVRLASATARA